MSDSNTGYCQQFRLYTGQKVGDSELLSNEAIVMELMAPYMSKGHTLHLNNWYSLPTLFLKLLETGKNVLETVRLNHKEIPQDLKNINVKKGETMLWYSHKMML